MIVLLALHGALGLGAMGFGARLGRRALALGVLGPLATLAWLAANSAAVLDGRPVQERTTWVEGLGIHVDLRLDGFACLMVLLVSGIGVLVYAYSARYFPAQGDGLGRLIGLLTLFSGSMLGLVLADNLLVLYTCWELTSITSYLLIGNDHTKPRARAAALQALLVTNVGGLVMLGGFVLIGQAAGTYRLSEILASPPSGTAVSVGLVLVAIGAFTKSAQYPFHSWLPGAMVAPTPVSAYLHSATMVKAGVYLVARLAPAFLFVGGVRGLVLAVGVVTMLAGGLRALRQHDLKLLLAFGTISQLGFMVVLLGVGTAEATMAGCVLLLAHGAFKAALFMVVGILDHETGTRDVRELPVLGDGWRPLKAVAIVAAASMAGVPLVLGFIAKESAYAALLEAGFTADWLVLAGIVVGSALTVAYSARFLWGAFVAPGRRGTDPFADAVPAYAPAHPGGPRASFVLPAAVLAVLTVVLGFVPGLLDSLVDGADRALVPSAGPAHLALWHGFEPALVLSATSLALGALLFAGRRPVGRVLAVGRHLPSGGDAYVASLRGLNTLANRATGVVQNGSLPVYTGVILLTAAVLPASALLAGGWWPGWPDLVGAPAQVPVAVLLIGAAIGSAVIRRRFSAALLLGVAGYAMAALFVVQGAPDLALTQAAIETLTTVIFVLVLRRLPDRFERHSARVGRAFRVAVASTVGVTVFAFMIVASTSRTAEPVSNEMVERALPDGHGRNVVNVILVDFRGLDTLGEITVLAAAAIGAVALARAGRVPARARAAAAAEAAAPRPEARA
ncbi:MAG: DUF4040 domain-containing protein [Acidimicrobiia bacterium]|nr:DUF4040 domain-containing protein [Acidimicrobiia bacterium]